MNALVRALIQKAGYEHGWENVLESSESAVVLASAHHRARARIVPHPSSSGWLLEVPSGLVQQELGRSFPAAVQANGLFVAIDIAALALLLRRSAELAMSLPNQAALTFKGAVCKELEKIRTDATEVERLVRQRVGQDTFRQTLMDYWGGACAVTGINLPEVLRASHAKPWADCISDEERLDVFNGFLLSANLDALFDRGLITFTDSGRLACSPQLTSDHKIILQLPDGLSLRWLAPQHAPFLSWHREHVFRKKCELK